MFAPGSGGRPYLSSISATCDATTGRSIISGSARSNTEGVAVVVTLYDENNLPVWDETGQADVVTFYFTIYATPNGVYRLVADNGEGIPVERQVTVYCTPKEPTSCTIAFAAFATIAPTSADGYGAITYTLQGLQSTQAQVQLYTMRDGQVNTYLDAQTRSSSDLSGVFGGLKAGDYALLSQEVQPGSEKQCQTPETPVTVPAYVPPELPAAKAPTYYAVGGVQQNPILLPCEVSSLTTQAGLPRVGLHLEVELRRAGVAGATIATLRKTVRKLQEAVEAAPYLRPELLTGQHYPSNSGLLRDAAAAFAFAYRYREVDSSGAGAWVDRPDPNYAVLAARPATNQDLQDITAEVDSYCGWASAFPSGAAVQFVGYPLEVGIIIPDRAADLPTFLEAVYYDAGGGVLEIRTWPLLATAAAGYYRICLPNDPLPCAAKLFLAICNENRAFAGNCAGLVIPPVVTPSGRIVAGSGYLIRK